MKKNKTLYWIITGLIAVFMIFTAIPDVMMSPDVITFMTHLGYPLYFIPFIGVAKILGSIAILIPKFDRIKEWAYAGLMFDLIGAGYSVISVEGFQAGALFIFVPIAFLSLSYYLYHQRRGAVQIAKPF